MSKDNADSIIISDNNESWVFHVLPIDDTNMHQTWAAQRVPDGHVAAADNVFIIREIDFNDPENFMWADNLKDVA